MLKLHKTIIIILILELFYFSCIQDKKHDGKEIKADYVIKYDKFDENNMQYLDTTISITSVLINIKQKNYEQALSQIEELKRMSNKDNIDRAILRIYNSFELELQQIINNEADDEYIQLLVYKLCLNNDSIENINIDFLIEDADPIEIKIEGL